MAACVGFLTSSGSIGEGRRSVTAVGHVGGATGRFESVGAGQNGTRGRGGVAGRGRLGPAGAGGGGRRGTAAGVTGAGGEGAPVATLDGTVGVAVEGGRGTTCGRWDRAEEERGE